VPYSRHSEDVLAPASVEAVLASKPWDCSDVDVTETREKICHWLTDWLAF
jgi:hypothetical protein